MDQLGSGIIGLLVGLILGAFLVASASSDADKRTVAAGVMRVGDKAYRVVPLEPAP